MIEVDYVVWDFDGVINDSIVDGRFVWADNIEKDLGFNLRVEKVFSSGRMGCMKPQPAFFDHVVSNLQTAPDRLLLIDDCEKKHFKCGIFELAMSLLLRRRIFFIT